MDKNNNITTIENFYNNHYNPLHIINFNNDSIIKLYNSQEWKNNDLQITPINELFNNTMLDNSSPFYNYLYQVNNIQGFSSNNIINNLVNNKDKFNNMMDNSSPFYDYLYQSINYQGFTYNTFINDINMATNKEYIKLLIDNKMLDNSSPFYSYLYHINDSYQGLTSNTFINNTNIDSIFNLNKKDIRQSYSREDSNPFWFERKIPNDIGTNMFDSFVYPYEFKAKFFNYFFTGKSLENVGEINMDSFLKYLTKGNGLYWQLSQVWLASDSKLASYNPLREIGKVISNFPFIGDAFNLLLEKSLEADFKINLSKNNIILGLPIVTSFKKITTIGSGTSLTYKNGWFVSNIQENIWIGSNKIPYFYKKNKEELKSIKDGLWKKSKEEENDYYNPSKYNGGEILKNNLNKHKVVLDIKIDNIGKDNLNDVNIKNIITLSNGADSIPLPNTFSNISDQINPSWNAKKYLGRELQGATYSGFSRELNFDVKLFSTSKDTFDKNINTINKLKTWVKSSGSNTDLLTPYILKLNFLTLYKDVTCIITNLSITAQDDYTWVCTDTDFKPMHYDIGISLKVLEETNIFNNIRKLVKGIE